MIHLDTSFLVDLLIATAALLDGAPLLTGNPKHFERVPELEVATY